MKNIIKGLKDWWYYHGDEWVLFPLAILTFIFVLIVVVVLLVSISAYNFSGNEIVVKMDNKIIYEGRSCYVSVSGAGSFSTVEIYKLPGCCYKLKQYTGNTVVVEPKVK